MGNAKNNKRGRKQTGQQWISKDYCKKQTTNTNSSQCSQFSEWKQI